MVRPEQLAEEVTDEVEASPDRISTRLRGRPRKQPIEDEPYPEDDEEPMPQTPPKKPEAVRIVEREVNLALLNEKLNWIIDRLSGQH